MPLINYQNFQEKEKLFIRHTIKDIEEFESWRSRYQNNANKRYRTLSESKYKIYTSVQRSWIMTDGICQRLMEAYPIQNFNDYVSRLLSLVKDNAGIRHYFAEQKIELNDALLFALLQHYGYPSPFIDFTYDLNTALFFCIPNGGHLPLPEFISTETIDDYFSVYVIDDNIDWFQCSMQRIECYGAQNLERLLADFDGEVDTTEIQEQIRTLDYRIFNEIPFTMIDGPLMGVQQIQIPSLGFATEYHIENPRIETQMGLFLCNPSENDVMEEVIYNTTHNLLVECFDIHKSLRSHIMDTILTPNRITRETMYRENDNVTRMINDLLSAALR